MRKINRERRNGHVAIKGKENGDEKDEVNTGRCREILAGKMGETL